MKKTSFFSISDAGGQTRLFTTLFSMKKRRLVEKYRSTVQRRADREDVQWKKMRFTVESLDK
jgi:hypothetical protein